MKKMMFLMLSLLIWGVASMNAQVKIGGNGTTGPVAGAVLELDGAQGALLLPRVDTLAITSPTAGMQVYREADKKVYTYDGKSWKTAAADVNLNAIPGTFKRVIRVGIDTTFTATPNVRQFTTFVDPPVDYNKSYIAHHGCTLAAGSGIYGLESVAQLVDQGGAVRVFLPTFPPIDRLRCFATVVEVY